MKKDVPSYVLMTAARDEESNITRLINSVIHQTIRPVKWVIVDDGSVDATSSVVAKYAQEWKWLHLVKREAVGARNFASKVEALRTAYDSLKETDFDLIGNVDADVSFASDYFEYLLRQFILHPLLGVAGTPFSEGGCLRYDYRFTSIEHVSGGCQLFRRVCFEAVGGYPALACGGEDWFVVTRARMLGWKTRTFTDRYFVHHRRMGGVSGGVLRTAYNCGRNDYLFGNGLWWEALRAIYQLKQPFRLLETIALVAGYLVPLFSGMERAIPSEMVRFTQREQASRVRRLLRFTLFRKGPV